MKRKREKNRQGVFERVRVREKVCERERADRYLNRMIHEKREKWREKRETEKDREVMFLCNNITK